MPAARESLLEAAGAALAARPWPSVRMVEIAAAAGVSRQTLYNEFGGKGASAAPWSGARASATSKGSSGPWPPPGGPPSGSPRSPSGPYGRPAPTPSYGPC